MSLNFLDSQIKRRRLSDQEMFQDAFSDLISVLGIDQEKSVYEAKGAIERILQFMGKDIPEVPESVTEVDAQLEYMLRPSGTMRRRVELNGEWWKDATGCFLASTVDGSVIAIIPDAWSGYWYRDKDGKKVKINKKTAKNINIDAFCFYRAFPLKKLKIRDLIIFMLKSISKGDIAFVLLAMLIIQLIGMLTPYTTQIIYNILIPSGSMSLIAPVAALLIGVGVGSTVIGVTKGIILGRLQNKLSLSVNSAVMMRMFSLPANFFKDYSSGELSSRIGYISSLCQMLSNIVLTNALTAVFSFGYFIQMYHYAPSLVIPGMAVIFITIIFYVIFTLRQQSIMKKKMDLAPKLQSFIYAIYGGIQKIKITGSEKRAFAKWAEKYSKVERLTYSPPFILKVQPIINLIISSLGTIIIYYFAGISNVSAADFMSFNSAYGMISGAIMSLSGVVLQMANLGPIFKMIKPVMEAEPESSEGKNILTTLSGDIEINNVKFKYSEDGPFILDDISLKIKKGEYVAIVGKTGCGKSTLLRVLLGFEKPHQGAVYYGGRDLSTVDLKSVRQKIGVVMQNGSLFPGDIFSNIIVSSPWKKLDDAWEAARMAGIEDDIKAMPMGMSTLISEGAGGISGGQKQRIMIARAIVSKPSVLYFDEATSALDNITQRHVSDSISKLNCTRLVIAHRLSTIKHCDRIIVLDNGKIAEEGCYEDLMNKKGKFYELAIRQVAE